MSRRTPNHEDFQFRGDDVTDTELVIAERRELYVPTGATSDEYGEQVIRVTRTLPDADKRRSDTPIMRGPAFTDDPGRPEDGLFNRLVANGTGHPVYSVAAPGVDFSEWRDPQYETAHLLTPRQHEELRTRGSYAQVGEAVMTAVRNADAIWRKDEELSPEDEAYIIHASSMGAAVAAGAIRAAMRDNVPLEGIVLSEPVNMVERSPTGLAAKFVAQNTGAPDYLKQNPASLQENGESEGHWLQRAREGRSANLRYARALARGALLGDISPEAIEALVDQQSVPVLLTRGTVSRLSAPEPYADVYQSFANADVRLRSVQYIGHDHPYTMTAQSVVMGVDTVKQIQ